MQDRPKYQEQSRATVAWQAARKSKVKIEQKSRSDSSDSEEEELKRLPVEEVTAQLKMEKRKALFLLLKASPMECSGMK